MNALEYSSNPKEKHDLCYKNTNISLGILKDIWLQSPDESGTATTGLYKLSIQNFEKHCFNRGRVYLSAQITSKATVRMLDDAVKYGWTKLKKEDIKPFQEILLCVDTFFDIMNVKKKKTTILMIAIGSTLQSIAT